MSDYLDELDRIDRAVEARIICPDEVLAAVMQRTMDLGFCLSCGAQQGGCEPDARDYECESCGELEVFGAEEILMSMSNS